MSAVNRLAAASATDAEFPTLQFAESVKSFVNKCQALCISSEEYRLMKLIALFQSAGEKLVILSHLFIAYLNERVTEWSFFVPLDTIGHFGDGHFWAIT